MPKVQDQLKGVQFAAKVADGGPVDLNQVKSDFLAMRSADAQQAAIETLLSSDDPMLQGLGEGLRRAMEDSPSLARPQVDTFRDTYRDVTPPRVSSSG